MPNPEEFSPNNPNMYFSTGSTNFGYRPEQHQPQPTEIAQPPPTEDPYNLTELNKLVQAESVMSRPDIRTQEPSATEILETQIDTLERKPKEKVKVEFELKAWADFEREIGSIEEQYKTIRYFKLSDDLKADMIRYLNETGRAVYAEAVASGDIEPLDMVRALKQAAEAQRVQSRKMDGNYYGLGIPGTPERDLRVRYFIDIPSQEIALMEEILATIESETT